MKEIMSNPCSACPYRRDVASGVWAEEEYDKLTDYDKPTGEQPFISFACHAKPESLCHGWAVCHSNRGHEHELISLRLAGVDRIPPAAVPLFSSGAEAAEHGKRGIDEPDEKARFTIDRLLKQHKRLKKGQRTN